MGCKRLRDHDRLESDDERLESQACKKMACQERRSNKSPDWARGLPKDILDLILDKLMALGDYIRFGAVCTVWRSVVLDDYKTRNRRKRRLWEKRQQQLPLLLLPPQATRSNYFGPCLYSITKQEVLANNPRPLEYYRTAKLFVGSSLGWLIFLDANNQINLFNPFRKYDTSSTSREDDRYTVGDGTSMIRLLYPVTNRILYYIHGLANMDIIAKAILSADPAEYPDDYTLALICGTSRELILFKPSLRRDWHPNITKADDVIYHSSSSSFYVAINNGPIVSVSINELDTDHGLSIETVAPETPRSLDCEIYKHREYIVENSSGNLLKIYRFGIFLDVVNFITTHFRVYEYSRDKGCWDELKSLGDEILFLGDNSSISIQASDFFGCLAGSIYYSFAYSYLYMSTKDPISADVPMDLGVFQLETRKSYPFKIDRTSQWRDAMVKQQPIWVEPTIQAP